MATIAGTERRIAAHEITAHPARPSTDPSTDVEPTRDEPVGGKHGGAGAADFWGVRGSGSVPPLL